MRSSIFFLVAALTGGLWDWLPYAQAHYSAQFFYATVGSSSGFFIAWCCIAFGMWINARRVMK